MTFTHLLLDVIGILFIAKPPWLGMGRSKCRFDGIEATHWRSPAYLLKSMIRRVPSATFASSHYRRHDCDQDALAHS
jgi:hypothetical protein